MKRNSDFYGSLAELSNRLERDLHFRLRVFDRLAPVTVIAPHGGFIEEGTSFLAQAVAGPDHNLFDFQGLRQERPWELHVTSTKFRHPYLVEMLGRSRAAVSLHSMGVQDNGKILIGGLNCELKERIYRGLSKAGYPVTTRSHRYLGVHPKNIVNLATEKGVQIELTTAVINRMFAHETPRFARDAHHLVLSAYGENFVAIVREALRLSSTAG